MADVALPGQVRSVDNSYSTQEDMGKEQEGPEGKSDAA